MNREAILAAIASQPWAISQPALGQIVARITSGDLGILAEAPDPFAAAPEAVIERLALSRPGPKSGSVAIVPVTGVIQHRESWFMAYFGGVSTTRLGATVRQLAADDSVGTIVLDIDSPGGTIDGLAELAAIIRAAAQVKTIVAIANSCATSAAYWIAAQADEVVATPEALVANVGVYTVHYDYSGMYELLGIQPTYISSAPEKTALLDGPLSDDGRAVLQNIIDQAYALFLADVAAGRAVTVAQVKADYGGGEVMTAKDAKAAGVVDRIATYADTIARLQGQKTGNVRAEGTVAERIAEYASRLAAGETIEAIREAEGMPVLADPAPDQLPSPDDQEAIAAEAAAAARLRFDADRYRYHR